MSLELSSGSFPLEQRLRVRMRTWFSFDRQSSSTSPVILISVVLGRVLSLAAERPVVAVIVVVVTMTVAMTMTTEFVVEFGVQYTKILSSYVVLLP